MRAAFPDATVFHTQGWARVLSETYGHQPHYLAVLETASSPTGPLLALLPLMEAGSWLRPRRAICIPFADFCAPLFSKGRSQIGDRSSEIEPSATDLRSAISDLRLPICDLRSAISDLFAAALGLGRSRGWRYLEWRGGAHDLALQLVEDPTRPPLASARLLSHELDLRPEPEALLSRFDASTRRSLRKAERTGLEVEFRTDAAAVEAYYRLHCLTRRKHGLPPQPYRFFQKIHEHLISKGRGFIALARIGDRRSACRAGASERRREIGDRGKRVDETVESHPVSIPQSGSNRPAISRLRSEAPARQADLRSSTCDLRPAISGAVFLHFGRTALYKFGASDDRFLDARPNHLVMYRSILHCRELGLTTLQYGRTVPTHRGLRRYKNSWGTTEREVMYYKHRLRDGHWLREPDFTQGWHTRLFRAIPPVLARWVGAVLYPHLD